MTISARPWTRGEEQVQEAVWRLWRLPPAPCVVTHERSRRVDTFNNFIETVISVHWSIGTGVQYAVRGKRSAQRQVAEN